VKKGGILLIDWGAKVEGYCSDMTRVVAFGKMPAKLREVYKVVLEAQQTAIDMIKPGAGLKAVYQASYDVIDKAGYDKRFQHGLGHGIGLDVHESPNMGLTSEGELQEGQVVTVEPGIYLPGLGGVRIEDDVLVTAKGRQVLSDLPKSLDSAMI
jgi:Xaa-Pro aminopeptidase